MRTSLATVVLASVLAFPMAAKAGWIVEGSYGKGVNVSPEPVKATQSNIMIAPGFTIPFLRFEVGFVNALPDLKNSEYDIEIRPMIVVAPPILPLYGRAIVAVTNLLENNGKTTVAYGGAAGLKLGLGPIGVFAEAGLLPRSVEILTATGAKDEKIFWVVEGRLGATLEF